MINVMRARKYLYYNQIPNCVCKIANQMFGEYIWTIPFYQPALNGEALQAIDQTPDGSAVVGAETSSASDER